MNVRSELIYLCLPVTSSHNITSGETDEEWNEDCNKETGAISVLSMYAIANIIPIKLIR